MGSSAPPDKRGPQDAIFMRRALRQAELAAERGEVPVGAVVVRDGRILAEAHNRREASSDPTAHAEILALRQASRATGSWRLEDATLYVTLEPCPMCAGALVAARIARLVFAAPDPKAGAVRSLYAICEDPRLNHRIAVVQGVLKEEASRLLSAFFEKLRQRGDEGSRRNQEALRDMDSPATSP